MPDFADIAKHLTLLTRKDQQFIWGPSQQKAFEDLKDMLCKTPILAYPNFEAPFILTTDASLTAVAAVLSQIQEGVERTIAYASRQMSGPEKNFCASEAELLALVWATKFFRCYLYGRRFVVRTDHAALTYLRNFSDNNNRMMRWSLRLSGLDFIVEHRAGSKIGHVDALSRHVGAVTHKGTLSKEKSSVNKRKMSFVRNKPGNHAGKQEFFLDDDGAMYRRRPADKHQLMIPETLVQDIIKENHDEIYTACPGARTYDLKAMNYWWPGMRRSIQEYFRKCDYCQRRKEDKEFVGPLGEVETPAAPFQVAGMDFTVPYPLTPRKNRYLLTYVDHYTRYVEVFPVPDMTAEICARIYASQIVTWHGSGSKLITDQGPAFISAFFRETWKILGIQRVNTSAYHPASNGLCERFHHSLHTGLSHFVNSSNTNWDLVVPFLLMAYRVTPNTVTGYSPFYL